MRIRLENGIWNLSAYNAHIDSAWSELSDGAKALCKDGEDGGLPESLHDAIIESFEWTTDRSDDDVRTDLKLDLHTSSDHKIAITYMDVWRFNLLRSFDCVPIPSIQIHEIALEGDMTVHLISLVGDDVWEIRCSGISVDILR